MPGKSDHDLLIEIHGAVFGEIGLIKQFKNHLAHHWYLTGGLVLMIFGLITKLLMQ